MTPLEIIALIIAVLSVIDAAMALVASPKRRLGPWTNFLAKTLKGKSRWTIPLAILVVILVFGYFILQQLTIIQIVPGLFLGILLMKMGLTVQYPEESIPIAKKLAEKIDWFAVALDLIVAVAILWSLFLR
jgi:hypothetical protein